VSAWEFLRENQRALTWCAAMLSSYLCLVGWRSQVELRAAASTRPEWTAEVVENGRPVPDYRQAELSESAMVPEEQPLERAASKPVLVRSFFYDVSAYTRYDDPSFDLYAAKNYADTKGVPCWNGQHPRGRGKHYDPARPYPPMETLPQEHHYTVAVPNWLAWVHEEQNRYGWHRYAVRVPGYTPEGVFAWPRDRLTKYDRVDVFMTGAGCQRRARAWAVQRLWVQVWEMPDMVP